jgi:hypothetical protein
MGTGPDGEGSPAQPKVAATEAKHPRPSSRDELDAPYYGEYPTAQPPQLAVRIPIGLMCLRGAVASSFPLPGERSILLLGLLAQPS